ncbi:MAG: glycosyltransferase [Candidatus Micrarchaeota archaeon]|nr:glycosyltransferase [Candidatus Micrarchaeota archaeon]MDE1834478.1 glycosyltransferase [Candidatus Micrarchaeota archaeon]MDE1859273.1 glycosyltransferase [Candidatus Micrarchaeota archaeon]
MAKISVVIPTIEEESVFELIKQLRHALGNNTEFIIVDKSSKEYFERLKATGAVLIRQTDRGVENAIMAGLRQAHGDILASIDADGTHDYEGIVKGVRLIQSGKADFVLGNRLNHLEAESMGPYLKFGNQILSSMFSLLYRTKVHDVLTGLFVVRRSAFDDIRNRDPYRAGISFFAIELARLGYRVGEVDIKYYKRAYGKSKLTRFKFTYGINVASHLIRQVRDYSPLLIFGGMGVIIVIIGLLLGITVLLSFLKTGVFVTTGRALVAFMLVVVGFLFFVSGLILDILVEIERRLMKMK